MSQLNGIIALWGASNTGKSTTLNLLIDELVANNGWIKEEDDKYSPDRQVAIVFDNQIIGISTGGDYGETTKYACEFFDKHNCSIVITATRTKGETTSVLTEYASQDNLQITWVKKDSVQDSSIHLIVNLTQVKQIRSLISAMSKEMEA